MIDFPELLRRLELLDVTNPDIFSAQNLADFESQEGIILPDDYKRFFYDIWFWQIWLVYWDKLPSRFLLKSKVLRD